jgi:hypothetical protein
MRCKARAAMVDASSTCGSAGSGSQSMERPRAGARGSDVLRCRSEVALLDGECSELDEPPANMEEEEDVLEVGRREAEARRGGGVEEKSSSGCEASAFRSSDERQERMGVRCSEERDRLTVDSATCSAAVASTRVTSASEDSDEHDARTCVTHSDGGGV